MYGGLPDTLTAITGNGKHLYFKHPGGTVKNSTSQLAAGVDVRADGGYVVAPPSLHANGERYRWEEAGKPMAVLPDWLLTDMNARREEIVPLAIDVVPQAVEHNPFMDAPIVNEGDRNHTLYLQGCALRGRYGMEHDQIAGILLEYNADKCVPPLSEQEVLGITASVCKHPAEISTNQSGKRLEENPLYWFPFYIRDFFSDIYISQMTDAQIGQWTCLMAHAWNDGGFLPKDDDALWRLARTKSRKAFMKGRNLILAAFVEETVAGTTRLKHRKMAAEYVNKLELYMKKKKAGESRRGPLIGGSTEHELQTVFR
jgi:uncharacterized protein YdaU (DUF1376 family)